MKSEPVTTQTYTYDSERDVVVVTTTTVVVTEESGEVWRNRLANAEINLAALRAEKAKAEEALGQSGRARRQ